MSTTFSAFLRGWCTLPVELRLITLGFVFARDHAIDRDEYNEILTSLYIPLLQIENADVATEALYKNNSFKTTTFSQCLPPRAVNDHLRRIEVKAPILVALGFTNIREISITFTATGTPGGFLLDSGSAQSDFDVDFITCLPTVKKLSVTRLLEFYMSSPCSVFFDPNAPPCIGTACASGAFHFISLKKYVRKDGDLLKGVYETYLFDDWEQGDAYTFATLPFEAVTLPKPGLVRKGGVLAGMSVTRVQEV
ncbi:hypothetical protein BU23DRAFT_569475 [Bimuria novae-zelandiae CBS 107.79]|uniref:Uncharacterized protein n=1 Tax=Bimuria novae-zelandiae CBS 107.79 TaxID=1447943 RepID=A0A6A5V4E2_9PLEO|nr:hypothetical protein BU23DRAFT_569475 [Bimuria novae-zelandiae CBS 107.79]